MRTIKNRKLLRLPGAPVVLNNDPEMAVLFRKAFPQACILHCFHNQHECKPLFRGLYKKSVDATLAVSDFTSRWIESHYGLDADSVRTLYNGVDTMRFRPSEFASVPPVIGFVGRTGIEKAPDVLLDAALLLADRTTEFRLQLVGSNHWDRFEDDEYQRRLNQLVARLESKGIPVRRPGHVSREKLPEEIRKAQIHVVPSRWDEPFGLATLEGMACGLATVVSDTGGTPEVVGDSALLFTRDSPSELAAILYQLITCEALRNDYQRRARERALELNWDRASSELESVIAETSLPYSAAPLAE